MTKKIWDPDKELARIKQLHKLRMQRRRWNGSCLDKYSVELTDLRQRGASLEELRIFLSQKKRDKSLEKIARSTIQRWLTKNNVVFGTKNPGGE